MLGTRRAAPRDRRAGDAELLPAARRPAASRAACCCRATKARPRSRWRCSPYGYWQRVFGSDPAVVGQTLDLTVKKAVIVGVLEPGAHYATRAQAGLLRQLRCERSLRGRVDAGRAPSSDDRRLRAAGAGRDRRRPRRRSCGRSPRGFTMNTRRHTRSRRASKRVVTPWKDELTAKARPTLMILLVTTVFVLVIACANVANLTLTRLVQREREMAIRAALGARGALLRRQLLAENLVLSVRRRRARTRARRRRPRSPDQLRGPIHEPHRRDRARRLGSGLHAGRLDRSGAGVRLGAAAQVPERSRAGDGQRRRARDRQRRPAPRAARPRRQPARGVVHAADRRGAADAQPAATLRGGSRASTCPTC